MIIIPLTKGYSAIVDDEDHEWLSKYKWHAMISGHLVYARRTERTSNNSRRRICIYMHRKIMDAVQDKQIDHINGNGIDNRKSNLRFATPSQNYQNRRQIRGKSKFKGVGWHKQIQKWVAYITKNSRRYHLGCYKSETEAALVYDEAAKRLFGDFAMTNQQILFMKVKEGNVP